MTDKELLQLAAKASGLYVKSAWVNPDDMFMGLIVKPSKESSRQTITEWNPLSDDGDALRLATKLRLCIEFPSDKPYGPDRVFINNGYGIVEDVIDDPYAATRRAIVRAAAEIGKGIK